MTRSRGLSWKCTSPRSWRPGLWAAPAGSQPHHLSRAWQSEIDDACPHSVAVFFSVQCEEELGLFLSPRVL